MQLLHLDSSILGEHSLSRQLTRAVVEQWQHRYPDTQVVYHDLSQQAPSHLSADILQAGALPPEQLSELQRRELTLSEQFIEEFLAAEVLVIGAPMYNFSIPSQLKAWFDRILAKGRTFKYTEQGSVGLAGDKQVVIVSTRGNRYTKDSANDTLDYQETYLKTLLGFVGISNIRVIRAEGVNINPMVREQAILSAQAQIYQ